MISTDAVTLLIAVLSGRPWPPPGVEDTPANRALQDETAAAVEEIVARGWIPDIPAGL